MLDPHEDQVLVLSSWHWSILLILTTARLYFILNNAFKVKICEIFFPNFYQAIRYITLMHILTDFFVFQKSILQWYNFIRQFKDHIHRGPGFQNSSDCYKQYF